MDSTSPPPACSGSGSDLGCAYTFYKLYSWMTVVHLLDFESGGGFGGLDLVLSGWSGPARAWSPPVL